MSMNATESFNRISIMVDNWLQIDFKLQNSDNIVLTEEILRNFLSQQFLFPPLIQPILDPSKFKVTPDQPLDLSMKTEAPHIKEFGYGDRGARFIDLPGCGVENSLLNHQTSANYSEEYGKEHHGIRNSPMLWQFLLNCLNNAKFNPSIIEWVCKEQGVFRLTNARVLAQLWGKKKHKPNMSEENLKRSLRYYYGKKILTKVQGHRDVYKFYFGIS